MYCLFGMPLFDALIHSIGALSTGGFSSHAQSIGYYDNIWIEMITIVLMLLGNINFLAHLFLIRGKLRNFFQYCEIRFSFLVIALAVPVLDSCYARVWGPPCRMRCELHCFKSYPH